MYIQKYNAYIIYIFRQLNVYVLKNLKKRAKFKKIKILSLENNARTLCRTRPVGTLSAISINFKKERIVVAS